MALGRLWVRQGRFKIANFEKVRIFGAT